MHYASSFPTLCIDRANEDVAVAMGNFINNGPMAIPGTYGNGKNFYGASWSFSMLRMCIVPLLDSI